MKKKIRGIGLYYAPILLTIMSFFAVAAIAIFAATLILMISRPRGINLGIAAGIGALLSILLGTVSFMLVYEALVNIWDAALAFLGIVLMSVTLDAMGFFKWAALRVAKIANGSGVRLFFMISLLTASVSILFANDSAVLILTPIVIEIVRGLKMTTRNSLAYLFGAGLIADTAAMPLITSNPVNILSADYFGYTFIQHLIFMFPVAVTTLPISILVVYTYFRKDIPLTYSVDDVEKLIQTSPKPLLLKISIVTLISIDIGYVLTSLVRIPVSFVVFSGAMFLFILYTITIHRANQSDGIHDKPLVVVKKVNWDILFFMVSIFIVVQGLRVAGVVDFFASLFIISLQLPSILSVLVPSFIITIGASMMNNWPMTIVGLISIETAANSALLGPQATTSLIFSNIIGNNLGPHFFPIGSLAILMWLASMRSKGLIITLRDYVRVGSVLSILEVLVASFVLWLELTFLGLVL